MPFVGQVLAVMSDALFYELKPYVEGLAKWWIRTNRLSHIKDDLMQAAYIGLLHVARNSGGEKVVKRYLFLRVIGSMIDEIRAMDVLTRNQRRSGMTAEVLDIDYIDVESDDPQGDFLAYERMADAIGKLEQKRRDTIIGIYFHGKSSVDIARDLGYTTSRISQFHRDGLEKLRESLCEHF